MIETVIIPLDNPSFTVRVHKEGSVKYATSFVVTVKEAGRQLEITLFRGEVPGVEWWREQAALHFPDAEEVVFERLKAGGLKGATFKL